MRLFVEPASGARLKKAYRGMGLGGLADFEQTYSDYREVSGVRIPFRIHVSQNGARFMEGTVREVKVNAGVDATELGRRPAVP